MKRCCLLSCLVFLCLLWSAKAGEQVLTLATTTSTENSGLLAHIHPDFEKQTGARIKVIAKGTGASLQYARDGNADVILVHARAREDAFLAEGHGINRQDVMYNDFVLLGPASDPAGLGDSKPETAAAALAILAKARAAFVSRGDASGTHFKEQALWRRSGWTLETVSRKIVKQGKPRTVEMVRPAGGWYKSIGQGMGKAITYATETRAYLLCDRGTYYAFALGEKPRTDLVILSPKDPFLKNPYGVLAVNPKKHPNVKYDLAMKYITWLTSRKTQAAIGDFKVGGAVLFHPAVEAVQK